MFGKPEQRDYFQELIDDAKNRATARGADQVDWNDIWTSLARSPETSKILEQRGVSTSSLFTEVDFITKFHNGNEANSSSLNEQDVRRIIDDVIQDLEGYQTVVDRHDSDERRAATDSILDYLKDRLRRQVILSDTEEAKRHAMLKGKVLNHSAQNALAPIVNLMMGGDPDEGQVMDIKRMVSEAVLTELTTAPMSLDDPDTIIDDLEELQDHPALSPSPVEVVDHVIANSGSFYEELLYRNGLRTNDPDKEDTLADALPSFTVQRLALRALSEAYSLNSKRFNNRHVALALLGDPEVRIHLSKLGVKDLIEFEDAFRKHSIDMDEKPKGRVSVHPEISAEMRSRISEIEEVYKGNARAPELLFWLMKNDSAIDKAMNQAGLRRRMQKDWRSKYDAELKDDDAGEDKEKKKEGFEISDQQLESLIAEYCIDYTALASKKKFDPMIGNEGVVEEVSTKLLKRGKKNPIIIGEPGVGKTKVLEGLSQAILRGKVPQELIGGRILMLDLHQMDDSPFKGMFESRVLPILKGISERNASGKMPPMMLAIDEFAVAQNTGTHSGDPNGFRGLIKPYLTSGDLIMMATTTEAEYRQQVEKDPALARRMQPVYLKEPTDEETTQILAGLKLKYSKHHKLRIPNQLMADVATLAGRYIQTVNQPDKSIDLLDEACALARKLGDSTLRKDHILQAVSSKTNIPVSFLSQTDNQRYADLEDNLLGQDDALKQVATSLKRAKAGFKDPNTPVGNFLFVGPTGVGKTELSKAIAEFLMGNEDESLVRFDMSEFQEPNSVNRFIGSPPGYVGYDEGGGLVKSVRSKPFAVYLYDEVEKAHPDVFNALLAPFSDGVITDGRGMTADMRHTINIMTSNIGAQAVMEEGRRRGLDPIKDYDEWQEMARPIYQSHVEQYFRPEFLNRLDGVIYFDSLKPEVLKKLVKSRFNQTARQLDENHGLKLEMAPAFLNAAAAKGFDVRYGARPLKRAWSELVEAPMADWLLRQSPRKLKAASTLNVSVGNGAAISANGHAVEDQIDPALLEGDDVDTTLLERRRAANINPVFDLRVA